MANADWSLQLFSLGGAVPSRLPFRFRLPSGQTRYSANCSLTEIHLAGFSGPFEYPYVEDFQVSEWDSSALTFVVRDKLPEEYSDAVKINLEVRALARLQLSTLPDLTSNNFDETYKQEWILFSSKLLTLLNKPETELLTYGDLPAYPTVPDNQAEFAESLAALTIASNYNRWKDQFETYGFIFYVPENVAPYFTVPADWVQGTTPLPEGTSDHFEHSFP
jgi:hypothetical protein